MSEIVRGCGTRVKAGCYAVVETSPFGRPLEDYLIDPPIKVTDEMFEALGLSHIGVKLAKQMTRTAGDRDESKRDTTWNVWDIVGERFYPNVADIIEEGRRFGFSRRLPRTLNFSLLNEQSRLILLHQRAWIENYIEYAKSPADTGTCPKRLPSHDPWWDEATAVMCIGQLWQDIEGGQLTGTSPRMVTRKMPSFEYSGYCPPPYIVPQHSLAIFASLPIGRIAVIRDDECGEHEQAFEKAKKAKLPVDLVDE